MNGLTNGLRKSVRISRTAVFSAMAGVLAVLLGAAGAPPAGAQASSAQQMIQSRANTQAKNLGLTPDQTQQLVQINTTALQQIQALRANPPADRLAAAQALRGIMDTRKASLGKLLTGDQMKKMTATNQKDTASLMTLSLDADLNLTDDQMKKTDKINLTYVQNVSKALNMSDKIAAAQALKSAQKGRDADLQKTLTPTQWTQYQAM